MRAWILVGGRLTLTPALTILPRPDLVVAADGGARHAAALGVRIDLWMGDFDSSAGLDISAPRQTFDRAKDSTDGELAAEYALAQGATELVFIGAFGGRFDHTFVLALGAYRLAQRGLQVSLHSGDEAGYPLPPNEVLRLDMSAGQTLSILAASELRGLSVRGARWPLERAQIPLGSGWTLSNEALGGPLEAQLEEGVALLTTLVDRNER